MTTATVEATAEAKAPPRKPVPDDVTLLDEFYEDPSKVVIKNAKRALAAEGISTEGKEFVFADPRKEADYYTDKGYEFVFRTVTTADGTKSRKQVKHESDPLMMIDATVFARKGKLAAALSRQQLSAELSGENAERQTRDRDGNVHKLEMVPD